MQMEAATSAKEAALAAASHAKKATSIAFGALSSMRCRKRRSPGRHHRGGRNGRGNGFGVRGLPCSSELISAIGKNQMGELLRFGLEVVRAR